MRAYVRRGHVGFRFGCLGTAVIAVAVVLAAEAAAAVGALVAVIVLAALAVGGTVRVVREYRRTTLKLPRYSQPRRIGRR